MYAIIMYSSARRACTRNEQSTEIEQKDAALVLLSPQKKKGKKDIDSIDTMNT